MQRCDLVGPILQLKALGVDNLHTFSWLAPPPSEAVVRGLETLHALGALDDDARQAAVPPPEPLVLCHGMQGRQVSWCPALLLWWWHVRHASSALQVPLLSMTGPGHLVKRLACRGPRSSPRPQGML